MVAEDGRLTINEKNRKRRGDKMRQEVTVGSKKNHKLLCAFTICLYFTSWLGRS